MKVSIGDAEVDFDRMLVTRAGETHRLTRQSAGILKSLVDASGEIVTKDMLIARVWDGRIITDATLSTAIKEARRAVGDSGSAQRIIETVHGVGFRLKGQVAPEPVANQSPRNQPCIAVLPFRNIGGNPADHFVSDGLTDEVISNLSRFRDLKVLARNTSEAIAAGRLDHAQMFDRYAVDYAVEGSVRRSDRRLRVTVQVASTDTGAILVTEQFNREASLDALFDVQDQIASLCAGRLAGPHGPVARQAAIRARAAPYKSWQMYRLVAAFRQFYRTYDPDLHARLRADFPPALAEDPDAADGWAAYAVILLEEHRYHVNERIGVNVLPLALEAAEKAAAADPQNAFAQVALAMCRLFALDVSGFDAAADKALALNSGNSDVLSEIGHCYAFLGREDLAIELLDRAMELSPEHPGWYHFARAWRYVRLARYDQALAEIQLVPMPGFYWYHAHLVWFHAALDDVDAARAEAEVLRQVFPDFENRVHDELTLLQENQDIIELALENWFKAGLMVRIDPAGDVSANR
ncbi:winged helix-turn-helix domain-containing protein [Roseobacter sp. YSTF-M11]|uniref:Winged helix-turn-helix domain-containing protein n=1 Tax=Roseobacter insulae TaxID=2859783 RepID=A0A9X1FWQ8_9RHOB|nr:winged helix-turn-helix domain-containing protein [Roseobacter insulae]MBW4709057.1 winged helix-turn-helix domain-containing protein [Roseobacter insulae]